MSAAQQSDQGLLDHIALTKNGFADTLADQAETSAQCFDLGNEIRGADVDGRSGSQRNRSLLNY
jgi:hypothetical protein